MLKLSFFKIKEIQSFAQQIAETISSVLNIDITIVDTDMTRVAGTGVYYTDINTTLPRSYAFQKVLNSGKKCFISNPGNSETCRNCIEKNFCKEKATMLIPVVVDENVVAAIGLVALTIEHRDRIVDNYEKYSNFMERMADLLAAKIKSEVVAKESLLLAKNLNAIAEAYPDGIISINSLGKVTHFNRPAEIILNIKSESILDRDYREKIVCPSLEESLKNGISLDAVHSIFNVSGNKIPVLLTTQPIKHNYNTEGIVCFFQELNKTKKMFESFALANTRYSFNHIKGKSPSILKVINMAKRVSPSDSTVLLVGESGTGKELFAKAIHSESKRSNMPFIAINCSAIPDTLLESELFGYEGGSFTGSNKKGKPGKFELANQGTIFLDEIGDMPLNLQAKILRVIQERVVDRVGGTKPIPVDVRIIAATNKDLQKLIESNQFREDLYYRINVIPIQIPPLRERREDIIPLSNHFLKKYDTLLLKGINGFESRASSKLLQYTWPGNVRELENAIEYAVNLETSNLIKASSLPDSIAFKEKNLNYKETIVNRDNRDGNNIDKSLKNVVANSEKQQILNALSLYGNSTEGKKSAAKSLGIGLSTLYRKIKDLDIK